MASTYEYYELLVNSGNYYRPFPVKGFHKMKRFTGQGLFLAAMILFFSHSSFATVTERTGKTGPDADGVEVIAGTGYGHTLFDSANNKCQHCHNDLYDTWEKSMHAQSWIDPLFQVKYQDFLRLQASKIGATGPTGTYGTGPAEADGVTYLNGTIQKTGQVCIKCHAPTAYYSGDYKITLTEVGDQNTDPDAYADAKRPVSQGGYQNNLAGGIPAYDPENPATVVSMAKTGKVYSVSYHIGNGHNREGINCAFCHSIETVRMMNDVDGDLGQYTLKGPLKMGPIGPIVRNPGDTLFYSPDASTPDMNAFFALIGPEKYSNVDATPKDAAGFDVDKAADGRYTMKSIETGCVTVDAAGKCNSGHYNGGPFYGPFGVTGLSNSRTDDLSDRSSQVKADFQAAVDAEHGDKFESKHHFAAYGKALCLSCHQRSSLMLNPEFNDEAGVQPGGKDPDQFLELCSTWTAMSDGVGNNFEDTATSPKCQLCHMEPLKTIEGERAVVLHQWDDYPRLFTLADNPDLTEHFLPPSDGGTHGPVAERYLNNHAFMGANTKDFGTKKIKTGFESDVEIETDAHKMYVSTYLQNKTGHMFPGAHPMRRVLTRIVVTDGNGNKLPFKKAKGTSTFRDITNQVAVLTGNSILDGFETVDVKYDKHGDVVIQGYTPDLSGKKHVSSQYMDQTTVDWVSPDGTVTGSAPVCAKYDPNDATKCISWAIQGTTTVKKITDIDGSADHFTRIYGRETGKRDPEGTHVVRPGFDSNIASDNRLKPNEREQYTVTYNTKNAVYPLTVKYKVYYLKKGGSGKFPTGPDGFYETSGAYLDPAKKKKLAIFNVFEKEVTINP